MQLKKHGGISQNAVMDEINLAYRLEDGMKIHIPTKQEKEEENKVENTTNDLDNEPLTTSSGVVSKSTQSTTSVKVNINTATQTQLETLPGIGPSTAIKIITYRKEKGKFNEISDIQEVSGIGEAKFEKIKDLIRVN